jgi:hypothetical protein
MDDSIVSNNMFPVYVLTITGKTLIYEDLEEVTLNNTYLNCNDLGCHKDKNGCVSPSVTEDDFIYWNVVPPDGGSYLSTHNTQYKNKYCFFGVCEYNCEWKYKKGKFNVEKSTSLSINTNDNFLSASNIIKNDFLKILRTNRQINLNKDQIGIFNNGIFITKSDPVIQTGIIYSYWYFKTFETGMKNDEDINNLRIYLNGIQNNKLRYINQKIPDKMAKSIRDNSIIYAITSQFYNQIYQTGPYKDNEVDNKFLMYLNIYDNINKYKTNLIDNYNINLFNLYSLGKINQNIINLLNNTLTMRFPVIKTEKSSNGKNKYYLYMYINNNQYMNIIKLKDKNKQTIYLQNCLSNFFRDNKGTINISGSSGEKYKSPEIIISFDDTQIINFDIPNMDNPINTFYYNSETFDFSIGKWNNETTLIKNNFLKIVNIEIKVEILSWSVMSVAYVAKFYKQLLLDINLCDIFRKSDLYTIPSNCMLTTEEETEEETVKYKSDIISFCNGNFIGFPMSNISLNGLLLNTTSNRCLCYNNSIAPPIVPNGSTAAMCFNTNCSNEIYNEIFDLNTENCKKHCDQVYYWMTNNNPAEQPQNKAQMNWSKFRAVCGESYNYTHEIKKYNNSFLSSGISFSILLLLFSYLLCKYKNYNKSKTIFILLIILIISILSVYGISTYFTGYSLCDEKELKCMNQYNKYIPNEFCDEIYSCECNFDQDCSNGCLCMSSVCYPSSGSRKSKTIYIKKSRTIQIIFGICLSILLPFIFLYYYKDFKPHINIKLLSCIIIILTLFPLIIVTIYAMKKYPKLIYTESCKNKNIPNIP